MCDPQVISDLGSKSKMEQGFFENWVAMKTGRVGCGGGVATKQTVTMYRGIRWEQKCERTGPKKVSGLSGLEGPEKGGIEETHPQHTCLVGVKRCPKEGTNWGHGHMV